MVQHASQNDQFIDLFDQVGDSAHVLAPWREDLTRRLRALLHADPLLALKRNENFLPEDCRHYDPLVIALAILDLIVENSGLYTDLEPEDVVRSLREILSAMDTRAGLEIDEVRHETMAMRVIGALRNDAQHGRPFEYTYTIPRDEDGGAATMHLRLRIIEDRYHPDGRIVLALSDGAANLFLNAIDLEIEDSQLANAAVIAMQIERGRFQKALRAAGEARLLSLRYMEKIETAIEQTRRNLRRVDWSGQVRQMLNEALDHITNQMQQESDILRMAEERLENLIPGSDEAKQVGRIIDLIRDCTRRHRALHYPLMRSRKVFLDEQERQAFLRPADASLPNPEEDLLARVMGAGARDAIRIIDASGPAFAGPVTPSAIKLTEMIIWQMGPKRVFRAGEAPVKERDWEDQGEPERRYSDAVVERAGSYLDRILGPTLLPDLVAEAEAEGEDERTIEALVLLAYRLFGVKEEKSGQRYGIKVSPVDGPPFNWRHIDGDPIVLLPKE